MAELRDGHGRPRRRTARPPRRPGRGTSARRCSSLRRNAMRGRSNARRRVAAESGQRLDSVLIQLGLVTERGLGRTRMRRCSTCRSPPAAGYPAAEPVLPDRLAPRLPAPRPRPARRGPMTARWCWPWPTRSTRSPRRRRRRDRAPRAPAGRACRSSWMRRSTGSIPSPATDARPTTTARRRDARGRCRAAEGPGERGAGHPAGQPDDHARRRDARLRHPYRAVRGPAARALPL